MRIWDLSLPLRDGWSNWPGEGRALHQRWISSIGRGDTSNTTACEGSVHLGTHVDAPLHFVESGASVADLDPGVFVGPATVLELPAADRITAAHLAGALGDLRPARLLLRTRNSAPGGALDAPAFDPGYCGVAADGARYLVELGLRLVGIDAFSVAPFDDLVTPHRLLLGAGIPVIEGLDLRRVPGGDYTLIALPLRLEGFEASPVRAVLLREA